MDSDGSGGLDIVEFEDALRKMGIILTDVEVLEIMEELDMFHQVQDDAVGCECTSSS